MAGDVRLSVCIYPQRCELCPKKEGALKRTDSGGIVCVIMYTHIRNCVAVLYILSTTLAVIINYVE